MLWSHDKLAAQLVRVHPSNAEVHELKNDVSDSGQRRRHDLFTHVRIRGCW
jgi:hypothetical protein